MKMVVNGFVAAAMCASMHCAAAELTHRWSFTSDYVDSVGGVTATQIGTEVSLKDGKVELRGGTNGAGSLNMGKNLLDTAAATVEIWATQRSVRNWARVLDYGSDEGNYFTIAWSQGTTFAVDRIASIIKNTNKTVDQIMAPYELGVQYYISLTVTDNGDGTATMRFARRNAKTGELQKAGSLVMGGTFADITDPVLYIGHSQYPADADAYADYDEVRIWRGVLTDEQLAANAVRGPDDATPGSLDLPPSPEGPAFATWIGGTPATAADFENAANWSCTDASGNAVEGAVPGTATTVVIAGGDTSFTIPAGVAPAWAGIRFGAETAIPQWGAISYAQRGGMAADFSSDWVHLPLDLYTVNGAIGDVSGLLASNLLGWKQFRVDGWFKVTDDQAGLWTLTAGLDDYLALCVDGCLAVMTHTYKTAYSSTWYMTPGWHRFTILCGDTFGGYSKDLTGLKFTPPGGTATAFTSLAVSDVQPATVRLMADCNLAALGPITLSNGVVIDLNGHNLIVDDITADYMGTKVTNSATAQSTLFFVVEPATSDAMKNLIIDRVQTARANSYVWTGAAGDGKFSTLGNWQLFNGTAPEALPTAGTPLFFTGAGGEVTNDLNGLGGASISFAADAGAFTIAGNAFTNVDVVANESGVVQTFSCEVFFDGTYDVKLASAPVNFAGGATATFPDESMRSSELRRTLVGRFNFTSDWVVPAANNEWPWIVADGSEVHGGLFTGTQHSHYAILQVNEGGRAYFSTITNGWDRGDVSVNGYLELSNEFIVRTRPTAGNVWSRFGREGNTGTVKARRIAKCEHAWAQSLIPNLIVGEGGIGSLMQDYTWRFYVDTTVTAYADFECPGVFNSGNKADWAMSVMSGYTLTFNVPEGLTVTCGVGLNDAGAVCKTGAGTLVMGNAYDGTTGFTKTYAGGTTVTEGTFKVDAVDSVGTGTLTLGDGVTLAVKSQVAIDSLATPVTGCAVLKPYGDFTSVTDGMKIRVATLAGDSTIDTLRLDTADMDIRRGYRVTLEKLPVPLDGGTEAAAWGAYLAVRKTGITVYIR